MWDTIVIEDDNGDFISFNPFSDGGSIMTTHDNIVFSEKEEKNIHKCYTSIMKYEIKQLREKANRLAKLQEAFSILRGEEDDY